VRQGCERPHLTLPAAQVAKGESTPSSGAQAQGGGNDNGNNNNNKKKKAGNNQPLAGAPTTVAAAVGGGRGGPRGDKRPRQPSNSNSGSTNCPVHNSTRHTAMECWEIKKLTKQFREKMQHQR
jgi:hypothetical protein